MALFLSGGGSGEDSKELDKAFVEKVGKRKPVLYIPLAREPPYESCLEWIQANFKDLEFNNFKMVKSVEGLRNIKLEEYSGVYIGGGNTYKLLNDLRISGFLKVLKSYVDSGGIVYGGSAGAIIFGKDISTANDEDQVKISDFKGLNKIGKFSIYCHYFRKDKKKVEDYIKRNKFPVIALPEKTGIIINGDKLKIVGEEPSYVFYKTTIKKILPNQKFSLA
ncbi:MAG: Type 1 glutamine amidotransferase-like domain-containing protein [Flavobacterium sp.]|uniref:Type 1 glutamine amidotransferase-like domain-containing protein n=1 Tax=Flavobacterium sp. TaxID=239 RepID=UPI002613DFC7|nr:Type 1 glutamine amidotransferase-like domain-containing protein [Flavobacterium sp.]MDD5151364.1 Type 1 glutamine amidotransferase-like domain-containing protein [Flavobacterium sp.]